jgi:hypothetical protein
LGAKLQLNKRTKGVNCFRTFVVPHAKYLVPFEREKNSFVLGTYGNEFRIRTTCDFGRKIRAFL